jgi:competence protein ComEA
MDESAAPWRALEDPPDVAVARQADRGPVDLRHRPWSVALIAAAVVLGLIAFWLAASANDGSVVVDGAAPATDRGATSADLGSPQARPDASTAGWAELVVDVQGAVVRPGVLHLAAGSRVGDAIEAAGGFGPRVAADRVGRELNLAAVLHDGDKIAVPSRDDPGGAGGSTSGPGGGSPGAGGGPIDLNRATASELDALPGIGPVTANKIIAAREEQPFTRVDELRSRKVVGAATFDKVKDLVVVR